MNKLVETSESGMFCHQKEFFDLLDLIPPATNSQYSISRWTKDVSP